MSTFQTLTALTVLIYALCVIVQILQEGVKWWFDTKATEMGKVIQKFMGETLLKPDQVKVELAKLGFKTGDIGDLAALENFSEADFRTVMDAIITDSDRPEIRKVLGDAKATVEQFKQRAEAGYDAAMAKFQRSYTKKNKQWVIGLSFLVVLALNASVVRIYDILAADQAVTQKLAATASNVGQSNQGAVAQDFGQTRDLVKKELDTYPILVRTLEYPKDISHWDRDLGLIIMGFLVSLGAPFWNDVLKGTNGLNNVFNTVGGKKTS